MLLRISSYTDAEVSVRNIVPASPVCCTALVAAYAFHKFTCIAVSPWGRGETLFSDSAVSTQCNDIADSEEFQIVKSAFDLFLGASSAYKVRDNFDVIFRHDGRTHGGLVYPVAHKLSGEASIRLFGVFKFVPVAGDVYVFRAEFHKWSYAFEKLFLGNAPERRNNLQ